MKSENMKMTCKCLSCIAPVIDHSQAPIRQEACNRIQSFAVVCPEIKLEYLDAIIPNLVKRSTDSNGPARLSASAALYFVLQMHKSPELADKVLNNYAAKIAKTNQDLSSALVQFAKRTVNREAPKLPKDDLLENVQQSQNATPNDSDDES